MRATEDQFCIYCDNYREKISSMSAVCFLRSSIDPVNGEEQYEYKTTKRFQGQQPSTPKVTVVPREQVARWAETIRYSDE